MASDVGLGDSILHWEQDCVADMTQFFYMAEITSTETASKTPQGLNLRQEEFCQAYTSIDRELFGNGTRSYLSVYGEDYQLEKGKPMTYEAAMVMASNSLRSIKIINRINELLEEGGFNDQNVDKQHLFLINQHADLKTKLGAIKEYNALKKRIENKLELILPKPILAYVQDNDSHKEDIANEQENTSDTGGDVSQQDDQHITLLDKCQSERQETNLN